MDNIFIKHEGIEIPGHRVDFLMWKVSLTKTIKIEYGVTAEGSPVFELISKLSYVFSNYVYRIGDETPYLMEVQTFDDEQNRELLLSSSLMSELNDKTRERLASVLETIVSKHAGITRLQRTAMELSRVLPDNSDNVTLRENNKKIRIKQRKLDEAFEELRRFEEKRNAALLDSATIKQATASEYWVASVDNFYNSLIEETFDIESSQPNNEDYTLEDNEVDPEDDPEDDPEPDHLIKQSNELPHQNSTETPADLSKGINLN